MSDLAHKLVTRPEWRYQPGILVIAASLLAPTGGHRPMRWSGVPIRVLSWDGDAVAGIGSRMLDSGRWAEVPVYAGDVPDLDDPATAGCLAVRLGEALHLAGLHGCWKLETTLPVGVWRVSRMGEGDLYGSTLGEAVARALISVWEAA